MPQSQLFSTGDELKKMILDLKFKSVGAYKNIIEQQNELIAVANIENQKAFCWYMCGRRRNRWYVYRYFGGEGRDMLSAWNGILNIIETRMTQSGGEYYNEFMDFIPCPACKGKRLSREILSDFVTRALVVRSSLLGFRLRSPEIDL